MQHNPITDQQLTNNDQAMQVLSEQGAQCGACGDEPGDRICPDCERCRGWYVAALRAAGWAPRAETIRDLADKADPQRPEISFFGDHGHEVGAWMRKQAEYAERAAASASAVAVSGGEQ